jgi:hypothetical protein
MPLKTILRPFPDRRRKQGQDDRRWSILGLIVGSLAGGRRGMKAAFLRGRGLTRRRKAQFGGVPGTTPWHAPPTETLRVIAARAPAEWDARVT